jgi:hypothetical protein
MPMFVYSVGCCFGTEAVEVRTALNMVVVVSGILMASWGEGGQGGSGRGKGARGLGGHPHGRLA